MSEPAYLAYRWCPKHRECPQTVDYRTVPADVDKLPVELCDACGYYWRDGRKATWTK